MQKKITCIRSKVVRLFSRVCVSRSYVHQVAFFPMHWLLQLVLEVENGLLYNG
jgi:hypothetical protein